MQQQGIYLEQNKTATPPPMRQERFEPEKKGGGAVKALLITLSILVVLAAAGAAYWFFFMKNLTDQIVIPYIAHQKPRIDPHVPSSVPIADKLDEVIFDGLFNVSANASGVTYEDGVGEFMGIDKNNVVSVRLKTGHKWHSSYSVTMEKNKATISPKQDVVFTPADLKFTLRRIQKLGSLSPDYILVSQAVPDFDFSGPDGNNEIRFQFKGDRIWTESDIKEVLSFKILPSNSEVDAPEYTIGSGPFMKEGEYEDLILFHKMPDGLARVNNFTLKPFIDNSTYTTELKNRSINSLLSTPFGAISPILRDTGDYFYKSSIATTFFAVFFNFDRLSLQQRQALKSLINNQVIMNRFFKTGTPQQRHIANYKGDGDNYDEYLNYSVFPTTSYYIEEQVITPVKEQPTIDYAALTDTVRIATCLNYDFREELQDLVEIMNDPGLFHGKLKVSAVSNEEIRAGNYDAVLVPVTGYRSNFLFDLYTIFLREPDFSTYKINLKTFIDAKGKTVIDPTSLEAARNFFRLEINKDIPEKADIQQFLDYLYGFMSTREIGDKQAYSQFIDQLDQKIVFGAWLFSLPSLAYFNTQFDKNSIDMYGTASQLSTVEKWTELPKRGLFGK